MRIFAGVPWREERQTIVGLSKTAVLSLTVSSYASELRPTLLYSIIYSIVAFPLTPKYVTLNDLKWPFYVKFCFKFKICLFTYMDSAMISMVKAYIIYLVKIIRTCAVCLYKAVKCFKTEYFVAFVCIIH